MAYHKLKPNQGVVKYSGLSSVHQISFNFHAGGGTGFIGRHLGELLLANGYSVMNVARMPGANNMSWSALELSGLPLRSCAVVNCAGQQFMDFTKSWTPG